MNKGMNRWVLLLLFLLLREFLPGEIPLKKAIDTGTRADFQYRDLLLEQDITRLNLAEARMKKLFQLDFAGSYLFKSRQMAIEFPETPIMPGVTIPGREIEAGAKHNYDLKLSLAQPIFTGGILANAARLEMQKQMLVNRQTTLREIEVAGKIKTSYFTYRLLQNKKKSLSLLLENLELHLKQIGDLYNEELVRQSDLLETEMKIAETRLNVEELNRLIEDEKIDFARLCTFNAEDMEKNYDEPVGTFQEAVEFFKNHHPVLKAIDSNIRSLLLRRKITTGQYLPQVNGFAELHYGRPGIDFFKNDWMLYVQGGISVNLKVFDWDRLKKEREIVDFSIQQLDNRKEEAIAEVQKNLAQLYARKESIEKQAALLGKLVETADRDAVLKEELYKEQQVSNIDYLSSLLTKERYQSLENERAMECQLVKTAINTLIGRCGEEK